jgi:hypothetical protein
LKEVETIYSFKCYEEFVGSTENTTMIGDGSEPWHKYKNVKQAEEGNGFSGWAMGEMETYSPSGYVVDIPIN